ncbi:hypothetical protein ACQ4PT_044692 [Festuca glaucescens]
MDDSPSVMRTGSNQEGSIWKDQTHSLSESQNRNQEVATNAEMSDDMWREQIMPISQNVYKQIRLLQQLIPINCKYTLNALYKEYLLNLEAYLDRVVEDLPSKLPSKGAMDLLVQKGVVCSCCGLLNSPLTCETCKCSVAGDTDKNDAVETRLNISPGMPLKLPDNVRKVDAAVAKEDVPTKIEGDFLESSSKGSGSAVYGSGATMKTCKVDSLACVTIDRGDCKDGSSVNPPARTSSVSGLNAGFAGYGHDSSNPCQGSSFQSTYTGHNSSYNMFGQQSFQSSQSAGRPRIVQTRGRWATHRNFGLSMQVGGYVHDYVMNVFAATVMEEQYDNSVSRAFRELGADPNALKNYIIEPNVPCRIYNFDVIMPTQIVSDSVNENDSGPHAMKVILQHSGGFQHKIRENDVKKMREQLTFYILAFQGNTKKMPAVVDIMRKHDRR